MSDLTQSEQPTLIGLPYSPWSEKARWALDASGVAYRKRTYEPMIGELGLRRLTGNWSGKVSVPVLAIGGRGLADSAVIAKWADDHGKTPGTLFPAGKDAEIARWIEVGEAALSAGRTLALTRQLQDPAALAELVAWRDGVYAANRHARGTIDQACSTPETNSRARF